MQKTCTVNRGFIINFNIIFFLEYANFLREKFDGFKIFFILNIMKIHP